MDAPGHRRGVNSHAADANRTGLLARSTSNLSSSSTSSDILVAPAHQATIHTQSIRPANTMQVSVGNKRGYLIFEGVPNTFLERLEASENLDPRDRPHDNGRWRKITVSSLKNGQPAYNDDDDGPNHKGTYSKAYTKNHPEVKWVHRGQGRYLPSNTVPYQEPRPQSGYTPSSKATHTPRFAGRSSLRRRSGDVDADTVMDEGDDEDDPPFATQPSHASKRLSDASYSLRRRTSEADPLTPGELRAARHNRRSGPLGNLGDDEDAEDDNESDEAGVVTYTKEYKDAHPEHNWRHCGNGFYKKGTKPSLTPSTYNTRRDSNRSQIKAEPEISEDRRYRLTDFENRFPNETPLHCGNGWWRRDSFSQAAHDQSAIESSDEEEANMRDGKFSKVEMMNYMNTYPDAQFAHRGNGRYVLTDDFGTIVQTPAAKRPGEDPQQTFSKVYTQQHPNEPFYHAGSGRYRRGSRPTRPSDVSQKPEIPVFEEKAKSVDKSAIPTGLVTKDFVKAHPEMEFHHRGQGRYAYGPRPIDHSANKAPTPVAEPEPSPVVSEPELVDTAYVEAHPNETFHHRGQGRWARGLPPPGSSNKTAVRGPMASQAKFSVTPSNPPAEDLPGLEELLIRSEGPDRYPHLDWVYRGGGKWARTPKKKEVPVAKSSRPRVSRGKSFTKALQDDSDESQEVVYTDDEYAAAVGGSSFQETPGQSRRPSLTNGHHERIDTALSRRQRKYLRQEDIDEVSRQTSKVSSQKSKTATPKPQRLTLDDDRLSDEDNYPSLYAGAWPPPRTDEPFDEAAKLMRKIYKPLNSSDLFVNALTRKDPATRPKEVLHATTSYVQKILQQLQDEYLELDKITAPHARVPRKPVKGGRVPLDDALYEDKKEADLYDYTFDPRKVGYQNPDAQKIFRDAEGRALRKRRQRNTLDVDPAATTGGEDAPLGPRRTVKPVSRFDGIAPGPTRRKRTNNGTLKPASMTPDPGMAASAPPPQVLPGGYVVRTTGRWKNHIPKRIRELRGDSVGGTTPNTNGSGAGAGAGAGATSPSVEEGALRSETSGTGSDSPAQYDGKEGSPGAVRKGRPKGSKNLHKRRDAGIPKGPRKPKVVASIEESAAAPAMQQQAYNPFGGLGNAPVSRDERNDPWSRIGSSRIGYPFD